MDPFPEIDMWTDSSDYARGRRHLDRFYRSQGIDPSDAADLEAKERALREFVEISGGGPGERPGLGDLELEVIKNPRHFLPDGF